MLRRLVGISILVVAILSAHRSSAQSFEEYERQMNARFEQFRTQAEQQYADFYREANARYADYLRREWPEATIQPATPAPMPNPPQPVLFDPQTALPQIELPSANILRPMELPKAEPAKPIPVAQEPKGKVNITLFGAECALRADKEAFAIKMRDCTEASVASAWQILADGRTNAMLNDCLALRDELMLCDWAYYQLAKVISREIYGSDTCNEAIVLQTYILTQSGYKVRMGRTESELRILLSSDSTIYSTTYLNIGDVRFYLLHGTGGKPIYVCDFEFPGESIFSMSINSLPKFPVAKVDERELQSQKYSDLHVRVNNNRNLIDFFETYPYSSIENYATASLDEEAKSTLYPVLKKAVDGMPEDVAANMLINFVQTAFEYKVDKDQFGYERPLFANETLFYPYCDCEDRALLYATLIRELLGLEVVLLDYPDHIATAVHFNKEYKGDYLMVDGKRFLICDPTYIGANIGTCMPSYRETAVNIVQLK